MTRRRNEEEDGGGEYRRSRIEYHTYSIVNSYPHDEKAFTQGFLFHAPTGSAYESTGSVPYGKASDVRRVDIETGAVVEKKTIAKGVLRRRLGFYERRNEEREKE